MGASEENEWKSKKQKFNPNISIEYNIRDGVVYTKRDKIWIPTDTELQSLLSIYIKHCATLKWKRFMNK